MRYLLIDEGDLVRRKALPANNFASLLFQLEHNQGIADVENLMQTIWNLTEGTEYTELRTAFAAWAKHVLLPRALPSVAVPTVDDLLEIKTMLTEHSRSWTHQWKAEGKQEGLKEGASVILLKQLQRKFGTLPPETQQRLQAATADQLETWSLNVLDVNTLTEVFKARTRVP